MEGNNQNLDTTMLQFDQLPTPPELNQDLLNQIDSHIKGMHWSASYQCISMIRSISKYYPQYISDLFCRYGPVILDLLNHSTTLLNKNILKLLKEVFHCGTNTNVQNCVAAFLPVLVRKAANETGHIKETYQEILMVITTSCCYPSTIQLATQLSCDKNPTVSELSIKLLAAIIQNIGGALTQLSPNTLQIIMKGMSLLINGKRNNMKTSALDTCMFIFNQIGSENFLQLMNYSLPQNQVMTMSTSMETHRTQKNKGPALADVLKQRKNQMASQRQSENWGHNLR